MQTVFTGPVYVVRDNIDTDQIISAQFLNLVPTIPEEYEKLGSYALAGLPESLYPIRYVKEGQLDSDYPIVVAGKNFGCGSSREHAPWALTQFGFRAVISSSFADIFANNSTKNGFLTVRLNEAEAAEIMRRTREFENYEVTIDLERCEVRDDHGLSAKFPIDEFVRHCLLNGLDDIGLTLQHESEISAYEALHPVSPALQPAKR